MITSTSQRDIVLPGADLVRHLEGLVQAPNLPHDDRSGKFYNIFISNFYSRFVSTHPSHYHNNYDDIKGVLLLCFHAASGYSSQCYCLWSKHDENCWYDEVRFRWSTFELNCIWLNKLWETLCYWLKSINIFQGWFCDEHHLYRHHLGGNEHLW